jgi:hypothetical protein
VVVVKKRVRESAPEVEGRDESVVKTLHRLSLITDEVFDNAVKRPVYELE